MGQSTNGQICFGINFEEGYEFPWDAEEFEGDEEKWWLKINGYKPSITPFGEDGDYLPNLTEKEKEEMSDAWYKELSEFREAHPLPVELVNTCSLEYPMYIIAVSSTCRIARRGYPQEFNPKDLIVNIGDVIALEKFCKDNNIKYEGKPQWYLSSYWG